MIAPTAHPLRTRQRLIQVGLCALLSSLSGQAGAQSGLKPFFEHEEVVMHWAGECADPVILVPGSPAGQKLLLRAPPQRIERLAEVAQQVARQRCPGARHVLLSLPTGARALSLSGSNPAAATEAVRAPVQAVAGAQGSGSAAPASIDGLLLRPASTLRRVSGSGVEACGAVADWLEAFPKHALDGFRDEHLLAVFGKTFDEGGGAWRAQTYQTTLQPCLTLRPKPAPIGIGAWLRQDKTSAADLATAGRVQQYSGQLEEAFNPAYGAHSERVKAYVLQVREHYRLGNALAALASAADVEPAALTRLDPRGRELAALTQLNIDHRERLTQHLTERRQYLAPRAAQSWMARLEALPRSLGTADELQGKALQAELAALRAALPAGTAQAVGARHAELLEASIAADVEARVALLGPVPSTPQGARELVAWENEFESRLAAHAASPSIAGARQQLVRARERVLAPLLAPWRVQVANSGLNELAARRAELAAWFGPLGERNAPQYAAFRAALDTREAVLSKPPEARDPGRLSLSAAGPVPTLADLRLPDGAAGRALTALFEGRFERVGLQPASLDVVELVHGYIRGYSERCRAQLRDPVELLENVCTAWNVRSHGNMEVSRTCISSRDVPTGVFAERSLYEATKVPGIELGPMLKQAGEMLSGRSKLTMATAVDLVAAFKALALGGREAGGGSSCDSPAQERLRVNMEHFLHGRPPKLHESFMTHGAALIPGTATQPYQDSNYERLLRDLMTAAQSDWAMERYPVDSVRAVQVVKRDAGGRPRHVHGEIWYQNKPRIGVAVIFEDGRPICIYTADNRGQCRSPTSEIVQAYVQGRYR